MATDTSRALAATAAASASRCLAEPLRREPGSLSPATLGEVGLLGRPERRLPLAAWSFRQLQSDPQRVSTV